MLPIYTAKRDFAYMQGWKAAKAALDYGTDSKFLQKVFEETQPHGYMYDPGIEYRGFEDGFSDKLVEAAGLSISRADVKLGRYTTKESAQITANLATAAQPGLTFLVSDDGPRVSPRFDIRPMPRVGDPVTKAFNGDYYPAGRIKNISPTGYKITTDTGVTFYRKNAARHVWKSGGTWTMVLGWTNRRNPSF